LSKVEAVVIGAGPNGLVAAVILARAGLRTVCFEAQAEPGGAARTSELTEPGFRHDVGGAFFPFGPISPAFRALDLAGAGLGFCHGPVDSAHPAPDGSCAIIARDLERTRRELGEDGPAWERLARWRTRMGDDFVRLALDPLPLMGVALRLGPASLLRFGRITLSSSGGFAHRTFRSAAARRLVPDLSLHADLGPDDFGGAVLGFVLALLAGSSGFPAARGGAGEITRALVQRLREAGGELQLATRVSKIDVRSARVAAVRLQDGTEVETPLVLADVAAPKLCFDLVGPELLPTRLVRGLRRFRQAWGTFKMDWALDGSVPWSAPSARDSNVVHLGGDLPALAAFTREVRNGGLPERPYLVIGQQSLFDPSRAPAGKHTLWAYSRVPPKVAAGWLSERERFADRVEAQIEAHAPGFRTLIRSRHIATPEDLEAMDENLVGGDLGGGTARLDNLLFFRPVFPYFRYRMGVEGLYLCSSYTHPGAGVHGACGYNAARIALRHARAT
jgi:phytoene dehydrogenase-like protein